MSDGDIHVWLLHLDQAWATPDRLSPDEQARAQRYRCRHARHSFVQTRAALRQVLGGQLGLPPLAISLEEGHHGKPRLAASLPRLEFNVSHSGQLALIALGRTPLGVDLEHLDRPLDWRELAPACCHPDELPALRQLPDREGHRRFLQLWTLREAYVKGTGEGLSQPPADLRLEYGEAAWRVAGEAGWRLHALTLPGGYVGSLATTVARPVVQLQTLAACSNATVHPPDRTGLSGQGHSHCDCQYHKNNGVLISAR